MARVFRYEEIVELGTRQEDEDRYDRGLTMSVESFTGHVERGQVVGALFYGSAVLGSATPSSDIDVLVATKDFEPETTEVLRATVRQVYDETGISLELIAHTVDQLKSGQHALRLPTIAWMQQQAHDYPYLVIGLNPAELITPLSKEYTEDIDEYLVERVRELNWSYIHGHDRNPELMLERVFNAAHKPARKTIDALIHRGVLPADVLPTMKKQHIYEAIRSVYGDADPLIPELQEQLSADFGYYMGLVKEVVRGLITAEEYRQIIQETLSVDLPVAAELTERIRLQYRQLAAIAVKAQGTEEAA